MHLFSKPVDRVTSEQREFVEEQLGVSDSISRFHFSYLLYRAYFKYWSAGNLNRKGLYKLKKNLQKIVKNKQ